jgi:hypothetical protein
LAVPLIATDNGVATVVAGMMERPLDEFAETGGHDGDNAETAATPSVATMRWTGEGEPCANCGENATRRWRDGDNGPFVCADCKDW